ncbi:hypothetical protein DM01DRAFT_1336703 [Hesseltinella vesiculosa]|uniref:FAR1 domain-containing protein n=1 Tax=Hesseltinella vesiculosa TaxID=101127 RepID=A0A1X2GF09_9FUNG|nr:hypothetical protein DM01DRAFT_1336703 [Hesseltinella vesiculosa]
MNQQQQPMDGSEEQLETFYGRLLGPKYPDNIAAINSCRALCAEYGFTVKQEASTHRNIYVYCSREGLPDSVRNPKQVRQRKRDSKRCDCRWRVVLFERGGQWEFRKSLNPEAANHNHPLMRPDEIEKTWPPDMVNMIIDLARQKFSTQDIRHRVRSQFPGVTWNERRFYNRLSDERQRIRFRQASNRGRELTGMWAKICSIAAGNEEISKYVEAVTARLLDALCQATETDPSTLTIPEELMIEDDAPMDLSSSAGAGEPSTTHHPTPPHADPHISTSSTRFIVSGPGHPSTSTVTPAPAPSNIILVGKRSRKGKEPDQGSNGIPEPPKGYATVVIPQHHYFTKVHTHRVGCTPFYVPRLLRVKMPEEDETDEDKAQLAAQLAGRQPPNFTSAHDLIELPPKKVARRDNPAPVPDPALSTLDSTHAGHFPAIAPRPMIRPAPAIAPAPAAASASSAASALVAHLSSLAPSSQPQQPFQPTFTAVAQASTSSPSQQQNQQQSQQQNPFVHFQPSTLPLPPPPNNAHFSELTFQFDNPGNATNHDTTESAQDSSEANQGRSGPTIHPALQSNPMSLERSAHPSSDFHPDSPDHKHRHRQPSNASTSP